MSSISLFRSLLEDLKLFKILDLCVGTHNLYLRRRLPDSLEIQQMKEQSKEERIRRQVTDYIHIYQECVTGKYTKRKDT